MSSENIKSLTPIVLAGIGGAIAIAALFSPNAEKGLATAAIYGAGAAGAYQNRSNNP